MLASLSGTNDAACGFTCSVESFYFFVESQLSPTASHGIAAFTWAGQGEERTVEGEHSSDR